MAVDLHTHSTASDGSDTPTELVSKAARAGLTAIALTDHDTQEGVPEALAAAQKEGIELVPGVELSLDWPQGGMHLVVLWLPPGPGPLQDRLAELRRGRDRRNIEIVERLNQLGLDITIEEVAARAGDGSVGRPHIAAVLVEKGYCADIADAFDRYLASGRPAYVHRPRLAPEEAISLARAGGAVPVLAHPHTLGLDAPGEMADLLERLTGAGLVGIECHYGAYDEGGRRGMVALAERFGLVPSGGSDYHGSYKPGVELGTGKVGLGVPDSVLADLAAARRSGP
ncbi:MAG: phosphatase [Acidimicrobiia bacterium]|nr:MAG: phosphatase [Acidimicrobiia bacterium]